MQVILASWKVILINTFFSGQFMLGLRFLL